LLHLVVAVFALVAGLFATTVIAITGLGILLSGRFFARRAASRRSPENARRAREINATGAIDVMATEVASETQRQ